jgi:hypothetical protein
VAVEAELRALMLETVVWKPLTGRNSAGEPTYGAPTTLLCRIERTQRLVVAKDGQYRVSSNTIYLDDVYGVTVDDQVTLPNSTTPFILNVETLFDDVGPYNQVIST